jgi:hypothetical protein
MNLLGCKPDYRKVCPTTRRGLWGQKNTRRIPSGIGLYTFTDSGPPRVGEGVVLSRLTTVQPRNRAAQAPREVRRSH